MCLAVIFFISMATYTQAEIQLYASELSAAFDLEYNNIMTNLAPGINEYEKSYFLTQAQKLLIRQLLVDYPANPAADIALRGLVQTTQTTPGATTSYFIWDSVYTYTVNGLRDDTMQILSETAVLTRGGISSSAAIVPLQYSELTKMAKHIYPYPPRGVVWRINGNDIGSGTDAIVHVSSKDDVYIITPKDYTLNKVFTSIVNYPQPIILATLSNEAKIDGQTVVSIGSIPRSFWPQLITLAVQLAKQAFLGQAPMAAADNQSNNQQEQ